MRTGIADLPLHGGHAPRWLFDRMVKLSRAISEMIVDEYGREGFLKRISDPFFFQSFSCVLGYDWHSSGTTTVTCGALKEAHLEDLGIAVLGGKGKVSRKTPNEIEKLSETFSLSSNTVEELKYASRMSAKVDNTCTQDGYQLYHHSLIATEDGKWSVIQQGMSDETKYARRYHWLWDSFQSFVVEPHLAVCCDGKNRTLNLVAKESEEVRKCSVDLVNENPKRLERYMTSDSLLNYLRMPAGHLVDVRNYSTLVDLHQFHPQRFEEVVAFKGVGAKTLRSLALISKLIFGVEISWRDPAMFSFCVGGKDGTPEPVNLTVYSQTIEILQDAIKQAKLGNNEKLTALKRLNNFIKM